MINTAVDAFVNWMLLMCVLLMICTLLVIWVASARDRLRKMPHWSLPPQPPVRYWGPATWSCWRR